MKKLIIALFALLFAANTWATLTPAQKATLKADIQADGVLGALPNNSDTAIEIAAAYNLQASPTFTVWHTKAPAQTIFDSITWSAFTPTDIADTTVVFTNRTMVVNIKQMNLQNMLVGRDTIDCSRANVRAGLRDAVIALPTGTLGAAVSAGGASGATVMTACTRTATRAEKALASGSATTGTVTGNLLTFEGNLSPQDVLAARQ